MRKRLEVRQRVYYAHAICMYGWPAERRELTTIRRTFRGSRIVNPAAYSDHPEKRRDTMGFCLRLVEESDAVVFSRLLGKVTSGVGKEVNHALRLGKPVFEVAAGKVVRRRSRVTFIRRGATISLYDRWRLEQYRNPSLRPR